MADPKKHTHAKTHYGISKGGLLVVRFADQSKPFSFGFEAGTIFAMLLAHLDDPTEDGISATIHPENQDLIEELAEATHHTCTVMAEGEGGMLLVRLDYSDDAPGPVSQEPVASDFTIN